MKHPVWTYVRFYLAIDLVTFGHKSAKSSLVGNFVIPKILCFTLNQVYCYTLTYSTVCFVFPLISYKSNKKGREARGSQRELEGDRESLRGLKRRYVAIQTYCTQTNRQTDRQMDGQTDRQKDGQTDRPKSGLQRCMNDIKTFKNI